MNTQNTVGQRRKPSFIEAIFPIIVMFLIMFIGYGQLRLSTQPLLICAAIISMIIPWRLGVPWGEIQEEINQKVAKSMPAILILLTVGLMISAWMLSGTIPMIIYYGIQIVNPEYLLVTAFIITALVSTVTGTSWGSVGTMGVALMGIASGLGVSLPATAGAVVAGSYFGDKISPLSDTTNLAALVAGSDLYEHIRHMLYTTIPAAIISLVAYWFIGTNLGAGTLTSPEVVGAILGTLDQIYTWNIFLLLPVLIVLYGSICKKPTIPVMVISTIVAALIGIFYQGFAYADVFTSAVNGFNVKMVKVEGFDASTVIWEVTRLINRGGMMSMMGTTLLVLCAFVYAAILSTSGCLEVILEKLLGFVKGVGGLIASTVAACLTMAMATGSSYLTILIPGELFREAFEKRGLEAKNLSRTLEDSGTVVVPLVPWSAAGAYMAATLGVDTMAYLPWAILCYVGFLIAIVYGFTGFGITKIDKKEVSEK